MLCLQYLLCLLIIRSFPMLPSFNEVHMKTKYVTWLVWSQNFDSEKMYILVLMRCLKGVSKFPDACLNLCINRENYECCFHICWIVSYVVFLVTSTKCLLMLSWNYLQLSAFVLQCVRLLQKLTYKAEISIQQNYVEELINFLIQQM